MSRLFQIEQDIEQALDAMAEAELEGTLDDEESIKVAQQWLDELAEEEQETIDAVGRALRKKKALYEHLQAEARRLQSKAQSLKNSHDRYRTYIAQVLQTSGRQKIKGMETTLYQISNESVHIDEGVDLYTLPTDCINIKVEPRKTEIKKFIKEGKGFAGISLVKSISLGMR